MRQYLVLYTPLIRKGGKVGKVLQSPVQVVLVPEQHAQRLLRVVAVLLLRHLDELVQLLPDDVVGGGPDEQGALSALLRPSVTRGDVGGRHRLVVSPHSDPSLSFVFTALP